MFRFVKNQGAVTLSPATETRGGSATRFSVYGLATVLCGLENLAELNFRIVSTNRYGMPPKQANHTHLRSRNHSMDRTARIQRAALRRVQHALDEKQTREIRLMQIRFPLILIPSSESGEGRTGTKSIQPTTEKCRITIQTKLHIWEGNFKILRS